MKSCLETKMTISIIICTYNRCESLKDTLDSLLNQENDGSLDCEVIVVDNNSKDKTKETIEHYLSQFNGRLRYVLELNQGLSYARNRGIKESKGHIVAFTDDDVILDKNWLNNIARCFNDYHCDGIGGRILPLYNKNTPQWIKENNDILNGPILLYDYGENVTSYRAAELLPFFGANMAYKRECFARFGLFRTDLGVGQGKIGEDTEFFKRLEKAKMNLYYCGNALVWHKVKNSRLTLKYIAKWWIASGRYAVTKDFGEIGKNTICYSGIPRWLIKEALKDSFSIIKNIFHKRRFLKAWIMAFWNIGRILEHRKIYHAGNQRNYRHS